MRTKINIDEENILELNYATWGQVMDLVKVIATILKANNINIQLDKILAGNTEDLNIETIIKSFMPILCDAVGNEDLINAIFKCSENSLINGERINKEFFEYVENRKLFFRTMIEIVKFNLQPFFKQVVMK